MAAVGGGGMISGICVAAKVCITQYYLHKLMCKEMFTFVHNILILMLQ